MALQIEFNTGSFVPTTNSFDISEIYNIDVTSKEFKELLIRLYQYLNNMSISMNTRDAGFYTEEEFVNGQVFPPTATIPGNSPSSTRQAFRKLVQFGALPNTATKNVAHGITVNNNLTFTRIYGAATDKVAHTYIPLPYASPTLNENVSLSADGTNIIITTGIDRTAYTDTWVIVEFLKS